MDVFGDDLESNLLHGLRTFLIIFLFRSVVWSRSWFYMYFLLLDLCRKLNRLNSTEMMERIMYFLFKVDKPIVWDSTCCVIFSRVNLVMSGLDTESAARNAKDYKLGGNVSFSDSLIIALVNEWCSGSIQGS